MDTLDATKAINEAAVAEVRFNPPLEPEASQALVDLLCRGRLWGIPIGLGLGQYHVYAVGLHSGRTVLLEVSPDRAVIVCLGDPERTLVQVVEQDVRRAEQEGSRGKHQSA